MAKGKCKAMIRAKRYLHRLNRNIIKFNILWRENGLQKTIKFLIAKSQGSKNAIQISFLGRLPFLRPGTPDLNVAFSCFNGEFDVLANHISRDCGGLIIDAGGYIGTAAIALAEMYPNSKIVSIEPSSENYQILLKNVSQYHNIEPVHAALMPECHQGAVRMVDRAAGEWGYTVAQVECDDPIVATSEAISVQGILRNSNFADIMIFKMDIEGMEYELLMDSSSWLPETNALLVELHPILRQEVENLYETACAGRLEVITSGEKRLSVAVKS
ncbi:FkbM family methyltransferase [Roseicyclus sp.]